VREALGLPSDAPAWLDRPAVSRVTTSSPVLMRPFDAGAKDGGYPDAVKPFNFLLSAHVAPLGHPAGTNPARFHLVAPYNPDARQWTKRKWTDVYSGRRLAITTNGRVGGGDAVRVCSYGDVIADFVIHPEGKSAGPDGHSCNRETRGLLRRRPVGVLAVVGIGKEANRLEDVEAGLVHDWGEVHSVYRCPNRQPWRAVVLPVLRLVPAARIARASGLTMRAVKASRNGYTLPHAQHRDTLTRAAAQLAREALRHSKFPIPVDGAAACVAFLRANTGAAPTDRSCAVCGQSLGTTNSRARFCSPTCRKRAAWRRR
jgi:hypothetical protein